jgi:hypothetical protein
MTESKLIGAMLLNAVNNGNKVTIYEEGNEIIQIFIKKP